MKAAIKPSKAMTFNWIWRQIVNKYLGIEERFVWLLGVLPQRFKRLLRHLIDFKVFQKMKLVKIGF